MAGPSTAVRRPVNQMGVSQTHRDVTDERYRDLRKPRRVRFFCNGDRYFKGKKMFITPHRYLTFNDLLNDLTGKLPSTVHLPYGVRQIYSPTGGSRIRDIEQLQDGENYVVAGFEQFKPIRYGKSIIEPWSHDELKPPVTKKNGKPARRENELFQTVSGPPPVNAGRPHEHDFYSSVGAGSTGLSKGGYGAFQPSRPIRASLQTTRRIPPGQFAGRNTSHSWSNRSEQTNAKPRVITVVRHSHEKPRTNIKVLLNRRTVQSYEQMMKDISEAFGPKWRNNKVKKLFSLKGKEVQGVSEFFRDEEVFIAVGNESLSSGDIQEVLHELYPDHNQARNLIKDLEKKKRRERPPLVRTREFDEIKDDATTTSKRDSGFGSDSSNRDDGERDEIYYEGVNKGRKKYGHEYESQARIERERQKASETEREKARKRMQKKLEAEQRALDEERRRKGLLALKPIQERDSFRKVQEEKEQERRKREAERRLREAEERARQEENARRKKKEEPKVIVVVKEDDTPRRKNKRSLRSQEDGYETDDDGSHLTPIKNKTTPRSNFDSAFDNYDSEDERERLRKEHEEKEKALREKEAREKAERERKEKEERERKERERLEKEKREREEKEAREKKEREEREAREQKEREERERKEQEEKDRRAKEEQEKERQRAEKEKREREEKEKKEKEEQEKLKQKKGGKTKMERQISNITHVMEKYEPGRVLGDGNFAIVKQCKLKNPPPGGGHSPDFAMKIIDKSKLKGKEHMIENEIEIMRLCDQPNIVKLVDEFETKDEIYLIMELVKGGDLFDAITQSVKFPENVAARMVSDVTNALFYLHSRHVVHRDLKPENLLVCRNRDGTITLKLADFGLAMEVTEPIYTVCGTPTYVAPEILSEIGYGLEVDMWAVGVITYILLCGFPPFRSPDRNQTELFEFIKAGEFEYLSPYWDSISKDAKDLISKLLVVKKSKRYTAIDVLCHPWVITQAGSIEAPPKFEEYRRNLRRDLEIQGKVNREEFLKVHRS